MENYLPIALKLAREFDEEVVKDLVRKAMEKGDEETERLASIVDYLLNERLEVPLGENERVRKAYEAYVSAKTGLIKELTKELLKRLSDNDPLVVSLLESPGPMRPNTYI
ncbi:MAG: hypothetical protein ACP5HQ_08875 [Thermoprotei archaeon]